MFKFSSFIFLLFFTTTNLVASPKIDPSSITLSGISSGAYMAGQLHVAYSERFSGVAIIAAGAYNCAQGNAARSLGRCMQTWLGTPSGMQLYNAARTFEYFGQIDSLENLNDDRVFLLSGKSDTIVSSEVVRTNLDFYHQLPPQALKLVSDLDVGHAFPTRSFGNDCQEPGKAPFMSACKRDIAGELLNHLLGKQRRPKKSHKESYYRFKQPKAISMGEYAYAYIPQQCFELTDCRIHVSFHGCQQTLDDIGDAFIRHTGLNQWAEANDLIVIYPQAIKSPWFGNPNGCWDWWGYSGPDYAVKSGVQMRAITKILEDFEEDRVELQQVNVNP